jgi:hypothetical protein
VGQPTAALVPAIDLYKDEEHGEQAGLAAYGPLKRDAPRGSALPGRALRPRRGENPAVSRRPVRDSLGGRARSEGEVRYVLQAEIAAVHVTGADVGEHGLRGHAPRRRCGSKHVSGNALASRARLARVGPGCRLARSWPSRTDRRRQVQARTPWREPSTPRLNRSTALEGDELEAVAVVRSGSRSAGRRRDLRNRKTARRTAREASEAPAASPGTGSLAGGPGHGRICSRRCPQGAAGSTPPAFPAGMPPGPQRGPR